jgi:hypothetical protein
LSTQLVEKEKQLLVKDSVAVQEFKEFMKLMTEQRGGGAGEGKPKPNPT